LCIGGDKIDWNIPGSVNTVFELLGVGKSSVYEYRKMKELKFKPHDRKR
jgi:predicted transcriptional regulator YheO